MFRIRPGTAPAVAEILSNYESPPTIIDETTRLVGTTVFLKDTLVVRLVEVEGAIQSVARHLAAQPQIREVERLLDPYLAETRDLSTPEGARRFLQTSAMERLVHRSAPFGPSSVDATTRHALLYPVLPGRGDLAADAVREAGDPPPRAGGSTALVSTTVFRRNDVIVRVFELTGSFDEAVEHLVKAAALHQAGRAMREVLDPAVDLTTERGLRGFFTDHLMTVVTDRRAAAA
jgi:hypothetical protein